jgi:nitrogen fixation protein NifZ
MSLELYQPGDTIFAKDHILNDGTVPDMAIDTVIAEPGTRGIVVNIGHFNDLPHMELLLVRFEKQDKSLGPAIGCWPYQLKIMRQ